jgi:cephalosporin hydroxylase
MKIDNTDTTVSFVFTDSEIETIKNNGAYTIANANKKRFIDIMFDTLMQMYLKLPDADYKNIQTVGETIQGETERNSYKVNKNIIEQILQVVPKYTNIIQETKLKDFKWKGLKLMKDPLTLAIYQQLLQDLRPKTIIEFGAAEGGSALWFSDICRMINLHETKIVTIDNQTTVNIPGIEFIHLDVNEIDNYQFKNYESPMLIIEDCHANMSGIVKKANELMKPGDYLVIEDTIDPIKYKKFEEVDKASFKRDGRYCDFWGKNNSWNYDSFLRKE